MAVRIALLERRADDLGVASVFDIDGLRLARPARGADDDLVAAVEAFAQSNGLTLEVRDLSIGGDLGVRDIQTFGGLYDIFAFDADAPPPDPLSRIVLLPEVIDETGAVVDGVEPEPEPPVPDTITRSYFFAVDPALGDDVEALDGARLVVDDEPVVIEAAERFFAERGIDAVLEPRDLYGNEALGTGEFAAAALEIRRLRPDGAILPEGALDEASDIGLVVLDTRIDPPGVDQGLTPAEAREVALLYEAGLDRDGAIDLAGLNFWIDRREGGLSEEETAQFFLDSDEFEAAVGDPDTLSDRALVEGLYLNVLDRPGEAAGVEFWIGVVADPGFSRARLLFEFATSVENADTLDFVNTLAEVAPGEWAFG